MKNNTIKKSVSSVSSVAKRGFTLVELLIVVAILGILAAIVLPEFQGHAQKAKEAAARDNLRILREVIERYAAEHNGVPPGYPSNNMSNTPTPMTFTLQLIQNSHYLKEIPTNPLNNSNAVLILGNSSSFPENAPGIYSWIYKPVTKEIRLDYPGFDSEGNLYYDY